MQSAEMVANKLLADDKITACVKQICLLAREDKGYREGIPHTHPIPQVIRLELFLESG